jgi:class 3 adenylate cyclase
MAEAMQTHDRIMRHFMAVHRGYEVKQNGDGFMIAFQDALDALGFCLDVQVKMMWPDEGWPEELLRGSEEDGEAQEVRVSVDGDQIVIFRGLRLRMSLHHGEPTVQHNPVTDRSDYLGPTVNTAARYIEATEPGQIVVSEPFLRALHDGERFDENGQFPTFVNLDTLNSRERPNTGNMDELRSLRRDRAARQNRTGTTNDGPSDREKESYRFELRLLGEHSFKGVGDHAHRLYFIVPESLKARIHSLPGQPHVPGSKGNLGRGTAADS